MPRDLRSDRESPADPWRRRFILGLGSLAIGGALGPTLRARSSQKLLRPPGAQNERQFSGQCVGCGTCQAVCPTGGLVPLLSAARLDAVFSPVFRPRLGPCLPDCTACGDACPSGAIPRFATEAKAAIHMGVAVIDRARCLPWDCEQRCVICFEACPPAYNAIELQPTPAGPFRPQVKESLCTGCGICEHKCPLRGEPAIRVVPLYGSVVEQHPRLGSRHARKKEAARLSPLRLAAVR